MRQGDPAVDVISRLRSGYDLAVVAPPGRNGSMGELARPVSAPYVVTSAELADCTCPEFCERDHANE